jgi:hypothetical protein
MKWFHRRRQPCQECGMAFCHGGADCYARLLTPQSWHAAIQPAPRLEAMHRRIDAQRGELFPRRSLRFGNGWAHCWAELSEPELARLHRAIDEEYGS